MTDLQRDERSRLGGIGGNLMQPEEVKSANEYVDKQMSTADLVAVASVGQSLTILREFTPEREALKTALKGILASGAASSLEDRVGSVGT